jgi:hypothetical protein
MRVVTDFNTGSSPANVVFQYGLTTNYGNQTQLPTAFPASSDFTDRGCILSGLSPSTTYHYRVVVTNGEGTATSSDATFTTRALPEVTTNPSSTQYGSYASISGTYNKQGGSYSVAFDYGATAAYGASAEEQQLGGWTGFDLFSTANFDPTRASTGVFPLLSHTTYHYRMKLTDEYGNSFYGGDETFTTTSPLEAWRTGYFNSSDNIGSGADTANPSGDGIPNLMKYALDIDPLHPAVFPQAIVKAYGGAHYLSMSFKRDELKNDIIYEVQCAESPAGPWTTMATSLGGAQTSGPGFVEEAPYYIGGYNSNSIRVEVRDTVSMEDSPHRFMRLKVSH